MSDPNTPRNTQQRRGQLPPPMAAMSPPPMQAIPYGAQSPNLAPGTIMGMQQAPYGMQPPTQMPPHVYQAYMYQMYQQNSPNLGYQQ